MDITQLMEETKQDKKLIFGMIHCLPLPGTLRYENDMEAIYKRAVQDAGILKANGVDAVIVENTNDFPGARLLEPEQIAALAAVTRTVTQEVDIPVGVDAAFNDGCAGLAIALCAGAQFIRSPVFVDNIQVTGIGEIRPCAKELIRYRRFLGAERIRIFADVQVKHSHPLIAQVTLEESCRIARDAGADGLIVTGTGTGMETPIEAVGRAKGAVGLPVLIGSGFNAHNAEEQLAIADGAIVGSALKRGGIITNPVDDCLCRSLMEEVRKYG